MNILEVNNFNVKINKFALNIPELVVKQGDIFHIKGKNGVGKTVFLNTLMGFMNYSGKLKITTKDVKGFINNDTLIPYLYPSEYFRYLEKANSNNKYLENCKSFSKLLKFDIDEKKYIRDLSEGNKKKVGIISILSLENDLMIFDEPYAYLDDFSCNVLDDFFINKKPDSTIIFSSHQETKVANDSFDFSEL
ncbi:Taurine import ATP-binding protein TauB [Chryseobacterium fistulae]|uniref:Taurine import ATP-binding protein TauB n=2 Tax=Chryseobacterium fistulae TaxID=2675058 RepID=A0A6N4XZ37_9FLAO|nr:Taurine import ATP-binding protein TauB [Chryseobacterium fistulae]